jgi:hypothetical protein
MLTRSFPPELVDEVIDATGRAEQRQRVLSARVVLYYVLAMALFAESSYEEAMRHLLEGLSWQNGWAAPCQVPTKAAIFKSRMRLGVEPLAELYRRSVRPLAPPNVVPAWYRGWRLVSLADACLDMPDTPANLAAFGQPSSGGIETAPSSLFRIVGLTEAATHVVFDVAMGAASARSILLSSSLRNSLQKGMLCLGEGNLVDLTMWEKARAGGAELLWSVADSLPSRVLRQLSDGSHLVQVELPQADGATVPTAMRQLSDADIPSPIGESRGHRLLTSILDPVLAPAPELSTLFSERWRLDATFADLRTHQRSPRIVLRSKSPDGVQQEVYGLLLVHFAIRSFLGQPHQDVPLGGALADPA